MIILGISALYHDSAAALIVDGQVRRAAQEERFTRIKNDRSFPANAIEYCMRDDRLAQQKRIDAVVYYDNPLLTCDRFIQNCAYIGNNAPTLIQSQYPQMFGHRMWIEKKVRTFLSRRGIGFKHFLVCEHHISHAAGSFFTSGFDDAAILVVDGVGEWKTTSLAIGEGRRISFLKHQDYPHSLGMLYSAFTYFCGFRVNSGEYKLMGLAAYGKPIYADLILNKLVDVKDDGSFRLNMSYFEFQNGLVMTGTSFEHLFGCRRREPDSPIDDIYLNIAASIQLVTEHIIIRLTKHLRDISHKRNLCLSGGCALNCVANGKILREGFFDNVYIQPASDDAGGCIGAALYAYHHHFGNAYTASGLNSSAYLGPEFSNREIKDRLREFGAVYHRYSDREALLDVTAELLERNLIVGLFQGRMEFGPRALGHRSILANPQNEEMQSKLNLRIKKRESFRPFAPAVLFEYASEYFDLDVPSPYMLLTAQIRDEHKKRVKMATGDIYSKIHQSRSDIPAVTHVDYSARIQTVSEEDDAFFHALITRFYERTGCPMVVNTSFNVRGEPIVCTIRDAYACFRNTGMDALVIGDFLLYQNEQPQADLSRWKAEYEAD